MTDNLEIADIKVIKSKIYEIRGKKVMLDQDLAALYEVQTRRLIEQFNRNIERFPKDFAFKLDDNEWGTLRSQIATSNKSRGGRRYNPYVFTEHGIVMLSSILRSSKAIEMNIYIVRAFVEMRKLMIGKEDMVATLNKHDVKIKELTAAVKALWQDENTSILM